MKSLLPIVLIVLALTAAITYSLAKKAVPKDINRFGISANQLENIVSPQYKLEASDVVTPSSPKFTITPSVTPTITPSTKITLPETKEASDSGKKGVATTTKTIKTTKTTVCTPVYGMANTCTEHVVVDTGLETAFFFNFAGLAYIGGLTSFIKAKSKK
jgi:hypothetical protein